MDKALLDSLIVAHANEPQFNPALRVREQFERPEPSLLTKLRRFYAVAFDITAAYQDGTDVSRWNTINSFVEMKAGGVTFVIIKASEGLQVDPMFDTLWRAALEAGLIIGVYHFFRGHISAPAQARIHLDIIKPLLDATGGQVLPSFLDVESSDGITVSTRRVRILEWLNYVRTEYRTPGVYSSPALWRSLTNDLSIVDFWSWVAHWTQYDFTLPGGWSREKTRIHQRGIYPTHSWTTPIRGIQGAIDTNWFFGTYDELRSFANISTTPVLLPECVVQTPLPVFTGPGIDFALLSGDVVPASSIIKVHRVHRDFVRISADGETEKWIPAYALNQK